MKFFSRIFGFLGEVRDEVRKVIFPSRSETLGSTVVVIVFVMILGVFLSAVDSLWFNVVGIFIR
ncbi:MAG: preprotein translocase subunit SecE [Nitrospirota bacterium]|nr:preprotein translocase subunit SecE [Nitrospirota bacterium]